MRFTHVIVTAILALLITPVVSAEDARRDFFENKIRPALVTYCYECHSADSKIVAGEFLLDSREGVHQGGESGPAIKAGDPDESLLIKAIRYTDESVRMPPKGKLPAAVIADFEEWVKQGAYDPRDRPAARAETASWDEVMRERSDWWSLRPVARHTVPPLPNIDDAASVADRFVRQKLAEQGLESAAPADPRTFIRRLSLVLTGLHPTVEQIDQFVAACRHSPLTNPLPAEAVEALVDSLLQSPHFGEHWARHWMDVVRFSETHGNEWNYEVHHAWRYRDYLIRAFNDDVPYDQFIREHIAGDLLTEPRWNQTEQFNESVIATGFFRFGEVNHDDCITLRSIGYDLADNQIDTLTKAFQATTVACARCHHHKLDAISTNDYYALLAVLRSSRNVSHSIDSPQVNAKQKQRLIELKSLLRQELGALWQQEASHFARYLLAAQATRSNQPDAAELGNGLSPERLAKWVAVLSAEKLPLEEPFEVWRRTAAPTMPASPEQLSVATTPDEIARRITETWQALGREIEQEQRARSEFNQQQFSPFGVFSNDEAGEWSFGGQSMNGPVSQDGEFVVQLDGESVIRSILPAGRYTHSLSSKLNGTLRSPVVPSGKKFISFQVLGERSSAVRLVSNHCQLNYANYRALTSPQFQWVTFSPPEDREVLRTYAELMTMFDNPKFPDQLSALGGDNANYRLPWEQAAENPRSYFGVTQVVLHDSPETPKPGLTHLQSLFQSDETPASESSSAIETAPSDVTFSLSQLADRYAARMQSAIAAWTSDTASEDDVRWLEVLLNRELISNNGALSPGIESAVQEYRQVEASLAVPRVAVGIADGGPGIDQPVFIRGDSHRPGETVPRRYLEVLAMDRSLGGESTSTSGSETRPAPKAFRSAGSGRLELAEQIASATNPLTARVMVNRVWHHLFGTGIVRTVDDFGHVGEPPSHPELLDELAVQFVEQGWSVKKLIRSLVLSQTFQQSNHPSAIAREVDPQNRLLQHYPARRMPAESVRDAFLNASGRLDRTLYGPSVQPFRAKEYADRRLFPGPLDGLGRRSLYIKNNLMEGPKFLETFNFPGGKVTQGRRDITNVPAQALALLNDPFVIQQSEFWANRLLANGEDTISSRLEMMFQTALGRRPDAAELSRFEETVADLAQLYQVSPEKILTSQEIWKDVAHSLFNLNEMIYIP
ncbi:PSD1 and planctomycete cytochrome C domain-containing protein [Schlesneria sp. T3-172]|uniref:PSD1 and planctomycete cytochrome C domain-containing protein n=1 Tax=Schlesneria sphaerica TaxID=3373610 RepID=UPI0037C56BAA